MLAATTTSTTDCYNFHCIVGHHIQVEDDILQHNSRILDSLADEILSDFKDMTVERPS